MKKTISILLLATTFSCTRQEPAQFIISIDKAGQASLLSPVALADLRAKLSNDYARLGNYPVYIKPESMSPFRDVHNVMMLCSDVGLWNVILIDESGSMYPSDDSDWTPERRPRSIPGIDIQNSGSITISCTDDARFGDMFEVLRSCETLGITNLTLETLWDKKEAEQKPPFRLKVKSHTEFSL